MAHCELMRTVLLLLCLPTAATLTCLPAARLVRRRNGMTRLTAIGDSETYCTLVTLDTDASEVFGRRNHMQAWVCPEKEVRQAASAGKFHECRQVSHMGAVVWACILDPLRTVPPSETTREPRPPLKLPGLRSLRLDSATNLAAGAARQGRSLLLRFRDFFIRVLTIAGPSF